MDRLFVIDMMPFLYKGHFVFLSNPRMTASGINTSALLGLAPPRYGHSASGWTVMDWNGRRIPHHTEHLHIPVIKNARETSVLATWVDAKGAATDLPAVAATRRGALFAHIPPLAYPAAQDLLRAIIAQPADAQPREGAAAQLGSRAEEAGRMRHAQTGPSCAMSFKAGWASRRRRTSRVAVRLVVKKALANSQKALAL